MMTLLLELGANPNGVYKGYTMWQYFIHYFHTFLPKEDFLDDVFLKYLKKSIEVVMKSGADLDIHCIKDS